MSPVATHETGAGRSDEQSLGGIMLRARHILQLTVISLLGLAMVVVHSAAMSIGDRLVDPVGMLLSRRGVYGLLALTALAVGSRLDLRELIRSRGWFNPLPWLILLSLALVGLTLVPGMGRSVNGASRWLYVGPHQWGLSFQPSEVIKWVLVLAIACWCTHRSGSMHRFWLGQAPILALVATACGLIMIEDLGTGVLIGAVSVALIVAAGAPIWKLSLAAPVAGVGLVGAILYSPYRMTRLTTFLDPWSDPLGAGYHPIQSMLTISQGGLIGRGLGNGIQKFGYLPEDTTDFVFAVICEEMGVAGAILVIGLYLLMLWSGWSILRNCRDFFRRMVILGVLLMVGLQTVINLAVVTVMVPTKGIALPLLSSGGTGWVFTAFAVGWIAAMDRADEMESPAKQHASPSVIGVAAGH